MQYRKIKVGKKYVQALAFSLTTKTLVVIRGKKGYIMCGYLNMSVACRFKEAAIKITGVATIGDALGAKVCALTPQARKLGVYKNQPVKDVLAIIA